MDESADDAQAQVRDDEMVPNHKHFDAQVTAMGWKDTNTSRYLPLPAAPPAATAGPANGTNANQAQQPCIKTGCRDHRNSKCKYQMWAMLLTHNTRSSV